MYCDGGILYCDVGAVSCEGGGGDGHRFMLRSNVEIVCLVSAGCVLTHVHIHLCRPRDGCSMKVGCFFMMDAASAVLGCQINVHLATCSVPFAHHQPPRCDYVLHVGLLQLGGPDAPDFGHYVASIPNKAESAFQHDKATKAAAQALVDLHGSRSVDVTMCKGPGDLPPYTPDLPASFEFLRSNTNLMFKNRRVPLPPPSPDVPLQVLAGSVVKDGDKALHLTCKHELRAPGNERKSVVLYSECCMAPRGDICECCVLPDRHFQEISCTAHVQLVLNKVKGVTDSRKQEMKADITLAVADTASSAGSAVSQRLMLKKWRHELKCGDAADAVERYFKQVGALCTRVLANEDWQSGKPTSNNASKRCVLHEYVCHARRCGWMTVWFQNTECCYVAQRSRTTRSLTRISHSAHRPKRI